MRASDLAAGALALLSACASSPGAVAPPRPAPAASAARPAASAAAPTPLVVPPSACAPASAPVTLTEGIESGSGALASVVTGRTLWVLRLGAPNARGMSVATLYGAHDLSADRPAMVEHVPLGEARSEAGTALASWQTQVVGAFGGAGRVTVFRYEPVAAVPRSVTIPAPDTAPNVSIAVVSDRALVAWDDSQSGVEYAWVELPSMEPSAKMRLDGQYAEPAAAPSFGGVIALTDSGAEPGGLRLLAPGAAAPAEVPAIGNDNGSGAAAAGTASRSFLLYNAVAAMRPGELINTATMKLATLTDAHGTGVEVDLGTAGGVPEGSLAVAGWGGAALAWSNEHSGVDFAAATADGGLIGRPFAVSGAEEPARSPAVAAAGNTAYVVWNQPEALELRLARVACQ